MSLTIKFFRFVTYIPKTLINQYRVGRLVACLPYVKRLRVRMPIIKEAIPSWNKMYISLLRNAVLSVLSFTKRFKNHSVLLYNFTQFQMLFCMLEKWFTCLALCEKDPWAATTRAALESLFVSSWNKFFKNRFASY